MLFGFDPHGEPTVGTADGALWLRFQLMPPSWASDERIPGGRWDDFAEQLTRALGVPVHWEDRELFLIETPPENALATIREFLHEVRRRYDKAGLATEPIAPDLTKPSRPYSPSERFEVGERVEHPSYGMGTVQASEPDAIILFFPEGRTHRFAQLAGVAPDLSKPIRRYAAGETFAVAERVEHPTFGVGTVQTAEPGKMTVMFPINHRRVLVQGRGSR